MSAGAQPQFVTAAPVRLSRPVLTDLAEPQQPQRSALSKVFHYVLGL